MPTYHNSNARLGLNSNETILTPANVNVSTFGKIGFYTLDGTSYAQPLYLASVKIAGGVHNVLYLATSNDSVYAIDADTGTQYWHVQTMLSGETVGDGSGCGDVPNIGITATPVIDRSQGANGTIFVVPMTKDSSGNYHHRIWALDITTGATLEGGPSEVTATYKSPSSGAVSTFSPQAYTERAALMLLNGVLYTTFGSHCDNPPYQGWIMSYSESTLSQTSVINVTPNASSGAIWMGGAGPSADSSGNIYMVDANGDFDSSVDSNGFPSQQDYGNAFLKLTNNGGLAVADYFWSSTETGEDVDFGSTGAVILPDLTDASGVVHHLATAVGKTGNLFVINRDNNGKSGGPNSVYQYLAQGIPGGMNGGSCNYFNNTLFCSGPNNPMRAFSISNALFSQRADTPQAISAKSFGGGSIVSANGTSNAIIWEAYKQANVGLTLHAYNPSNLSTEYYNTLMNPTRDAPNSDTNPVLHFLSPTIVNGKVYVPTTTGIAVYGLLP